MTMLDDMKERFPDVTFYVRRRGAFELIMSARTSAHVVRFVKDGSDGGLYLGGFHGQLGTPMAARGPVESLERLKLELK